MTLIILAFILVSRLVWLTIVRRSFLKIQGDTQALRFSTVPAYRGVIRDREGELLAISIPTTSVWIDPAKFHPTHLSLEQLANLLTLSPDEVEKQIARFPTKNFVWLKRGLSSHLSAPIQELKLPGLFLKTEYKRYYSQGAITAHILGLTNADDQGQEGLEKAYDPWLQGQAGLKKILQNRLQHKIADLGVIRSAQQGRSLNLSLDQRIQYTAFQALNTGVQAYQAQSGSIVVMDITTGEILSMVNCPSYNPNQRHSKVDDRYRNRAVTDLFEPGSTLKPLSMANILSSGCVTPESLIDTNPGWIAIGKNHVQDARNYGLLDLASILRVSSNVGITKLNLKLPPENFWSLLHNFGFGEVTDSRFPGERSGNLPHFSTWSPFMLATLSFGYGLSVTALQLAQAYATLANEGIKLPITFLRVNTPPSGQRVLDAQVSRTLIKLLESVISPRGTAPLARIAGYRVAGKTGTTLRIGEKGYDKSRYNRLFVGIAPASRPRLVVVIILQDVLSQKRPTYSHTISAIFSRVMSRALYILGIPPDDPLSKA